MNVQSKTYVLYVILTGWVAVNGQETLRGYADKIGPAFKYLNIAIYLINAIGKCSCSREADDRQKVIKMVIAKARNRIKCGRLNLFAKNKIYLKLFIEFLRP